MAMERFEDRLTEEQRAFLYSNMGKMADRLLAEKLGTYSQQIRSIRARRGIELEDDRVGRRFIYEYTLTEEQRRFFFESAGKMMDSEIAKEFGTSPANVRNMRVKYKIPTAVPRGGGCFSNKFWTAEKAEQFIKLYTSGEETQESIMKKMDLTPPFAMHVFNIRMMGYEIPKRRAAYYKPACAECEFYVWKAAEGVRREGRHICKKYGVHSRKEKAEMCEAYRKKQWRRC